MPQITSWTIPNSGGSTYRAAVNTALSAIQSSSSGTAAPSPTVAGMLWYDTTNSILQRRNTANTAWIEVSSDTVAATSVRGNASAVAAVEDDLTMASLRTMIGFPTAAVTLGQWVTITAVANAALTLPAGGTWAFYSLTINASSGAVIGTGAGTAGVAAGGTIIASANSLYTHRGFAWRVA